MPNGVSSFLLSSRGAVSISAEFSANIASSRTRIYNSGNSNSNNDYDDVNDEGSSIQLQSDKDSLRRRDFFYNSFALVLLGASGVASWSLFQTNVFTPEGFQRLPRTQFIAALGDPKASEGAGANLWGLWFQDPGPRGVWLKDYASEIVQNNNQAPAGWTFDPSDWWVEEHGLIMESPNFPLKEGRYLVTGGRLVTTGLTIDRDGRWKLDEGTLYDVTHLPCRSARYQPQTVMDGEGLSDPDLKYLGTPLAANIKTDFPVAPGAIMPEIKGCNKQDYAVLFVVGKATSRS
jgi:hypothetical protein